MLTRIRNALAAKKPEVILPHSKLKANLASLLQNQGWLDSVETVEIENMKSLKLKLKYDQVGNATITGLQHISRPGQRIYAKVSKIPRVKVGYGATIISTSRGLMTDKQARKEKLGGEIICQIW